MNILEYAIARKLAGGSGGSDPVLQSKAVTPSNAQQIVAPDEGYDGLSDVTVHGDENLTAENIAYGVSVFGIIGTFIGSSSEGLKVATGTFTLAKTTRQYTVEHPLGFIPKFVFVWYNAYGSKTVSKGINMLLHVTNEYGLSAFGSSSCCVHEHGSTGAARYEGNNGEHLKLVLPTENDFTISVTSVGDVFLNSGYPYNWIAIGD